MALEFPEFQRRLEAFCFSVGIYAFFTISGSVETPPARTAAPTCFSSVIYRTDLLINPRAHSCPAFFGCFSFIE
jgi:hypothetical protein